MRTILLFNVLFRPGASPQRNVNVLRLFSSLLPTSKVQTPNSPLLPQGQAPTYLNKFKNQNKNKDMNY